MSAHEELGHGVDAAARRIAAVLRVLGEGNHIAHLVSVKERKRGEKVSEKNYCNFQSKFVWSVVSAPPTCALATTERRTREVW